MVGLVILTAKVNAQITARVKLGSIGKEKQGAKGVGMLTHS